MCNKCNNKTAGYHRQILRLPNLVKMHFWKMKTFFPRKKNTSSSSDFLFFPLFKVFCFLPNKPHNEGWKHIFTYHHNIRIIQQTCYFQRFLKKLKIFFRKTLFFEKPNFWTFWKISAFQSHSMANLLPWAIFEKFNIFVRKTHLFFFGKPKFWTFWEFYYFSCILRQIGYNLMK